MSPLTARLQALLRPGDSLWWGQATAEPLTLTRALVQHRHALAQGGRLQVFVGLGLSDTLQPAHADVLDFLGYAASGPHRALAQAGVLDIIPAHYSQFPPLLERGALSADVVFLQVSPPDSLGRHSLGQVREYLPAAMACARVIVGEVHPDVPWTTGGPYLQAGDFDLLVDSDTALPDMARTAPGAAEQTIAAYIASLVEDGSCLQLGVGNLPEAVLAALRQHKDLGLHSGAIGDGVVALAEAGVLTHARKNIDPGVGTAGVLMGGARLRQWAHHNPQLQLRDTGYTHHPEVLAGMDKLVAINAAIEVDLTGQINAEVAGGVYMGAVGGAVDFLRGAARSKGGLPIVALPSTAKAHSRIVASLSGPVSTPRADAGLIVTEHGVADLRGQPLSRRVRRLIDIAAPAHQEHLEREAHGLLRQCGAAFPH
ncbi:acetyl-CoA hydrolase/transferase family protein [Comamonas composti]|uniref:acetyl-CoA hydrolase/transferase family protein n=1 Tax=Comamonas composti TaxID=408558 RepID=UPI0003F7969C|nr:acetyl-CoA hydrolase/transferase C-terminal domain-containing protein [Comamonas composti]